jgi:outer membrane protein assembly factor BamE (lipoprotein component of BamABCDE complex)
MARNFKTKTSLIATALVGALALGACAPNVDNRGNLPDKKRVASVKPGTTTRGQVLRLLGSPSTVAALDRNTWYYISKREEHFAFLNPKVRRQQVLVIKFNKAGVVQTMSRYSLKDAKKVKLVARETPTTRGEPGMIRQLYETFSKGPIRPRRGATQGLER